jgi:hypothetical protein
MPRLIGFKQQQIQHLPAITGKKQSTSADIKSPDEAK